MREHNDQEHSYLCKNSMRLLNSKEEAELFPSSVGQYLHKAIHGLAIEQPKCSIYSGLWLNQKIALLVITIGIGVLSALKFISVNGAILAFSVIIVSQIGFRFFAAFLAFKKIGSRRHSTSLIQAPHNLDLPKFTLLIPLYREESVVVRSVEAMKKINYPSNKLEVFYILESDDLETIKAVEMATSDTNFRTIIVPNQKPKTKPKALNYGLQYASGQIITVYDAEDIPHPEQLLAVANKYAQSPQNTAVIQAPLHAYNGKESWIAAQFSLEYAIHFDVWLPAMVKMGWPIPLGGTSNHFDHKILTEVGGWDPYNVTEDADLGYRLALRGYGACMIDLPTMEEAPVSFSQWLPQRTRWIKGHIQSLFVLTRDPMRTFNALGIWNSFGALITFIAAIFSAGLHAPFFVFLIYCMCFNIQNISIFYFLPFFLAYLSVVFAAFSSTNSHKNKITLLTSPLYWPLMSIAFIRAIWELNTSPHSWAKTPHGLSKIKVPVGDIT